MHLFVYQGCTIIKINLLLLQIYKSNIRMWVLNYVTRSTMSVDLLLFLCFFVIIIFLPMICVRIFFFEPMKPIFIIVYSNEVHNISNCSRWRNINGCRCNRNKCNKIKFWFCWNKWMCLNLKSIYFYYKECVHFILVLDDFDNH